MIPTPLYRTALVLALSCLALAGCERKPETPAALHSETGILRFIPADTPYVLVNAEPIDEALLRKMTGDSSLLATGYQAAIRDALVLDVEEYPEGSEEREEAERAARAMTRLAGLLSLDGMREAGIDINESLAVYGHGLLPVVRARLVDRDAFETAVASIERDAEFVLETGDIDGNSYRFVADDEARVVLGAFDDYVVLTLVPAEFTDAELRKLLGLELPDRSLAAAGTLADIAKEYGYTSHYLGFVDILKIAATFVDQGSELDSMLLAGADFDRNAVSDVCREEILEMAGIAPRAVYGYRKIAADGVDASLTLELRPDIAVGLMTLPAVVPGLGADHGGLFTFGFSVDPSALRSFYEGRLDAIEADPYQCEYLADVEANAARGRQALSQPIPPFIYDFRGMVAVFDDVDFTAMRRAPQDNADAAVLLAMEDAPSLLVAAGMFSPDLAALDIQPDGLPVPLELPQTASFPGAPYVALTDSVVAVSTGSDAVDRLERLLAAEGAEPAPFMSFTGDAGRYYSTVAEAVGTDDGADLSPEATVAIHDAMLTLAEVYDRFRADVHFTRRGVEVDIGMSFKD